jgi:thermitase
MKQIFRAAFLLFPVFLGWSHAYSRPPALTVHLKGERLTLHAQDQDLVTVLQALSDQGIRIRIDPQINPKITASFTNRRIGAAMASMLKSVDYALIWRKDNSSTGAEPRLWEIRIFYKGNEARIQPLRKRANLIVVGKDDGTHYVKDVLLLRLAPNMTKEALAALVDRLGATVIDAYAPMGIVRLLLPDGSDVAAIAATIAGYPGVQAAEPDYAYPLEGGSPARPKFSSTPPAPSGVPLAGATAVAVMDSGLLSDYDNSPFVKSAYDAVSPGTGVGDALGHGTQMTLIAAGAVNPLGVGSDAPAGSPVVAIRAIDDNGYTSTYTLIRGIDYAIENGARVLSLSWGSETSSSLLETAMHYAAAKGLIIVAAAGNAPTGTPVYPAAYDDVIGVGALAPDGEKWDQSNFGDFVAVTAPGMADLPVGYEGEPGTYAGTSIATAYTARRIAAILDQHPDADRKAVLRMLKNEK